MKSKYLFLFLLIVLLKIDVKSQPSKAEPYFTAIVVSDIDTSVEWYSKNLGMTIRNKMENAERGFKIVILESDGKLIELLQIDNSVSKEDALKNFPDRARLQTFMKIGFAVDKFDEWHKFLEGNSVKFRGRVVTDQHSGKKTFLVEDPDGNIIQFFEK